MRQTTIFWLLMLGLSWSGLAQTPTLAWGSPLNEDKHRFYGMRLLNPESEGDYYLVRQVADSRVRISGADPDHDIVRVDQDLRMQASRRIDLQGRKAYHATVMLGERLYDLAYDRSDGWMYLRALDHQTLAPDGEWRRLAEMEGQISTQVSPNHQFLLMSETQERDKQAVNTLTLYGPDFQPRWTRQLKAKDMLPGRITLSNLDQAGRVAALVNLNEAKQPVSRYELYAFLPEGEDIRLDLDPGPACLAHLKLTTSPADDQLILASCFSRRKRNAFSLIGCSSTAGVLVTRIDLRSRELLSIEEVGIGADLEKQFDFSARDYRKFEQGPEMPALVLMGIHAAQDGSIRAVMEEVTYYTYKGSLKSNHLQMVVMSVSADGAYQWGVRQYKLQEKVFTSIKPMAGVGHLSRDDTLYLLFNDHVKNLDQVHHLEKGTKRWNYRSNSQLAMVAISPEGKVSRQHLTEENDLNGRYPMPRMLYQIGPDSYLLSGLSDNRHCLLHLRF